MYIAWNTSEYEADINAHIALLYQIMIITLP